MSLDDALHVNGATCYLNYCKSPLRHSLNTEALIMVHVGGYNVSGEVQTFPLHSHFHSQASFAETFKKHCTKEEVELGNCQESRQGHGNLVSYQIWFSQQLLYLKHLLNLFGYDAKHIKELMKGKKGGKRFLGKLKAEFCYSRNIHWKKSMFLTNIQ